VPSPLSVKTAPEGRLEVERVGMVESASEAETTKFRLIPSVTVFEPIAVSSGAWLPDSPTVMVTISESAATPSEAIKVTL